VVLVALIPENFALLFSFFNTKMQHMRADSKFRGHSIQLTFVYLLEHVMVTNKI